MQRKSDAFYALPGWPVYWSSSSASGGLVTCPAVPAAADDALLFNAADALLCVYPPATLPRRDPASAQTVGPVASGMLSPLATL